MRPKEETNVETDGNYGQLNEKVVANIVISQMKVIDSCCKRQN